MGRGPCEGAGNYGTEMGDTKVGGGPRVGAGAGVMAGVGALDWDGGEGADTRRTGEFR